MGCSELENPIGIETSIFETMRLCANIGCSELENPIGIETVKMSTLKETEARKLQRT